MKALVINATINEGVSKKQDPNGRPYQINTVTILVDFEPRTWNNVNGSGSSRGCGKVIQELPLDPEALPHFTKHTYPCWLELETESQFRGNNMIAVVTGCKPLPDLKAA